MDKGGSFVLWARNGLILLGVLLAAACLSAACAKKEEPSTASFFAMDTYMTFTVYGKGGEEALGLIGHKLSLWEGLWSVTDPESDLYRINHGTGGPVLVHQRPL